MIPTNPAPVTILAFCGSLRQESYNKTVLEYAQSHAPEGVTIEIASVADFPLYNQELDNNMPKAVQKIKERVKAADAILFVTPEYNYSVPGVLKNAIDWISRPYGQNSFEGKPVGIMSASISSLGGARAQYHLRQSFVFLNMHDMKQPEFMLATAQDKIEQNEIKDDKTQEKIVEYVEALAAFTRQHLI